MGNTTTQDHSIKFNKKGISQVFEMSYSSQFKLFDDIKKVTARFRKNGELIVVDYKFIDTKCIQNKIRNKLFENKLDKFEILK